MANFSTCEHSFNFSIAYEKWRFLTYTVRLLLVLQIYSLKIPSHNESNYLPSSIEYELIETIFRTAPSRRLAIFNFGTPLEQVHITPIERHATRKYKNNLHQTTLLRGWPTSFCKSLVTITSSIKHLQPLVYSRRIWCECTRIPFHSRKPVCTATNLIKSTIYARASAFNLGTSVLLFGHFFQYLTVFFVPLAEARRLFWFAFQGFYSSPPLSEACAGVETKIKTWSSFTKARDCLSARGCNALFIFKSFSKRASVSLTRWPKNLFFFAQNIIHSGNVKNQLPLLYIYPLAKAKEQQ